MVELSYPGKIDRDTLFRETSPVAPGDTVVYGRAIPEPPNRLYHGDNLPVLRALYDDETVRGQVRLVYIDPPYSSKRSFSHRTRLYEHAYSDHLSSHDYVEFLRRRLIMLRDLLAPDGSIYLHLDGNMAFHIKVIMDEIFGEQNFRNWITRKKCHSKNYTKKQYGNVADYILYYSRSGEPLWNRPYEESSPDILKRRFPRVEPDTGRRFALVPIHAPGTRNGETGKPWRGMLPPPGKHWQVSPAQLDDLDVAGAIHWSPSGNPRRKIYADASNGIPVQDIWTQFVDFGNQNMETTGYPTEKNYRLLRRIVEASSNPGDLVLDCFCGSGTTMAVARELGRRWIGIDSSPLAIETSIKRLSSTSQPKQREARSQLALFDSQSSAPKRQYLSFSVITPRAGSTAQSDVRAASS